jgi:hypothetical protein
MDNQPDYSKYSLVELYEVYHNINKEKYGDRFDAVVKEIEKREQIIKENPELKHYSFNIGKIRSFWSILGLTFVTIGFYLLYWTYKNIDEINKYFHFYKSKNSSSIARKLFGWYIFLSIVSLIAIFIGLIIFGKTAFIKHPFLIIMSLSMTGFNIYFHYHFVAAIILAQEKIGIQPFSIFNVFIFFIMTELTGLVSLINPVINWFGFIFYWIFIYLVQDEINKVWIAVDGKKNSASIA